VIYQIAHVAGMGLGLVLEQHAHYAVIQLHDRGIRWEIVVDDDDYEIYDEISIGHEEIM